MRVVSRRDGHTHNRLWTCSPCVRRRRFYMYSRRGHRETRTHTNTTSENPTTGTDGRTRTVSFLSNWRVRVCPSKYIQISSFFFSFAGLDRTRNRPGFDCHDSVADILVLFDVDWAVDDLVPDGRVVGPVHHVNLDFDRAR